MMSSSENMDQATNSAVSTSVANSPEKSRDYSASLYGMSSAADSSAAILNNEAGNNYCIFTHFIKLFNYLRPICEN